MSLLFASLYAVFVIIAALVFRRYRKKLYEKELEKLMAERREKGRKI
ncbi:MAG: hypothetical protein K9N11_10390 [Lentisphaeria bacterium]|nr:hypothetical protein [Candidatus Neomarinimicrobiota bacterium]MCF7843240.1 hypothetical protein [Lentisphaeria bacterium]